MNVRNKEVISETEGKFKDSKFLIFADCSGLSANDTNTLRRELKRNSVEFKVMKNTLSAIILKKLEINGMEPYIKGPTAIAFCSGDEVAVSKLLANFEKEHQNFKVKAGLLDSKIVDTDMFQAMAKLPRREVLISKLLNVMQMPILNLINVLQAPTKELVNLINAKIKTTDK